MKIRISLGADKHFEFESDTVSFNDARALIDQWYSALTANNSATQNHIDQLAAKFGQMADGIDAVVAKLKTTTAE